MSRGMQPPPPAKVAAVARAVAQGQPKAEIARAFGVSEATVRNWAKQAAGGALKPPGGRFHGIQPIIFAELGAEPAEPARPNIERLQQQAAERDDEPAEDDGDADTLTTMRRMLKDTLQRARDAERVGNWNSAQKCGRDAAALVNTITRLERLTALEADVLRISRTEIAERRLKVRQRIAAICERPLLCSACSRKLSIKWGGVKMDDEPQAAE